VVCCAPFLVCAFHAAPLSCCHIHSCSLNPAVGNTFSGHAEFELLLEAVSHDEGAQCIEDGVRTKHELLQYLSTPCQSRHVPWQQWSECAAAAASGSCVCLAQAARLFSQVQQSTCCRPPAKHARSAGGAGDCQGTKSLLQLITAATTVRLYVVWFVLPQVMLCGRRC
jgi:hypothetical protein